MSHTIKSGSTDQYAEVKVWTTADGLPKTDITNGTAGLSIKYQLDNGTVGTLSAVSMTAGGSHADGGIYHIGNGRYKIGLSDAMVSAVGKQTVWIELTDTDCTPDEIRVVGYDPEDGLSTFDAASDTVANVTTVATTTDLTNLPAIPANWLTAAGIAASALDGKGDWSTHAATDIVTNGAITTLTGAVVNVTTVATTTTNTDMRGTDSALLASSAPTNWSSLGITVGGAVSNVTTVATTTTNTDMRGTDGANTVVPLAAATDAAAHATTQALVPSDLSTEWPLVYDTMVTGITSGVEAVAGKHSVAGTVMMSTNASISGGTLTANKPSDDTAFATYTVTTSASADNITGIS